MPNILTSISFSERNESIPPRRLDFCLLCLNLDLVSQSLRREPPHHQPLRVLPRHNSTNHPPGGARQLSRTYAAPHIGVSRQSYARRTCVRVRCPAQTDWRRWAQVLSAPLASPHTLLLCFHKPCFHPWQTGTTRVHSAGLSQAGSACAKSWGPLQGEVRAPTVQFSASQN